jgi:hypothetical protein
MPRPYERRVRIDFCKRSIECCVPKPSSARSDLGARRHRWVRNSKGEAVLKQRIEAIAETGINKRGEALNAIM